MLDYKSLGLYIGPDIAFYLGPNLDFSAHSHHAVQLAVGLNGRFQLSTNGCRSNCDAVLIGADQTHQFHTLDDRCFFVYFDPETYGLTHTNDQFIRLTLHQRKRVKAIIKNIELSLSIENLIPANELRALLQEFGVSVDNAGELDQRVKQALDVMHETDCAQPSQKALQNATNLSPSRLQHLFSEQMGIPVRRYSLWLRLKSVVTQAASGESLTDAAHRYGFSDSSHFSRVFRQMFGISPSKLLSVNGRVPIIFCE